LINGKQFDAKNFSLSKFPSSLNTSEEGGGRRRKGEEKGRRAEARSTRMLTDMFTGNHSLLAILVMILVGSCTCQDAALSQAEKVKGITRSFHKTEGRSCFNTSSQSLNN
jgi:hypothetical protein